MKHSKNAQRGYLLMSDGGPRKIGVSFEVKPHAYDPITNPELFEGVLARRCIAFVIDLIIIAIPVVFAAAFIFIVGLVTLGLGWILYWLLSPASVIWAICYYGLTFGSPASATIGMRAMDYRNAYLVRGARLFRAGRGACHRLLGYGLVPDAVDPSGRVVQSTPSLVTRHAGRHDRHQ